MISKTILRGILMAAILWSMPFAASADPGHGHGDGHAADTNRKGGHHGASEGHGHGGASGSHAENPASAWSALMATRDAIADDVDRGALGDIHEKSEPLPELAAELLEQSKDLEASKRMRVKGAIQQVKRVAAALHTAADGDDLARVRKDLSRLDGLLKLIRAQYPAGVLETGAQKSHGHGEHSRKPGDEHGAHARM